MADLNKKILSEVIAEKHGLSKKEATDVVNTVFEEMVKTLKNEENVEILGFGKFCVKERSARSGINPLTKEKITIPATKVPTFKFSKSLKDSFK